MRKLLLKSVSPMRIRSLTLPLLAVLAPFNAAFLVAAVPEHQLLAEFERPGTQPLARLIFVPADGNYYGTTTAGGTHNRGTVFRMTPAGALTTLVSFAPGNGAARGNAPDSGLVLGADGALYGVTLAGGEVRITMQPDGAVQGALLDLRGVELQPAQ